MNPARYSLSLSEIGLKMAGEEALLVPTTIGKSQSDTASPHQLVEGKAGDVLPKVIAGTSGDAGVLICDAGRNRLYYSFGKNVACADPY